MRPLPLLAAAAATVLLAAGPADLPSVPDLLSRGMRLLSDEDVLREFPGSTFEVSLPGLGTAYVETFGRNGLRRLRSSDAKRIPDVTRQWWVEEGKLCLAVPNGTAECGRAVGQLGEDFYRLGDNRVIARLRRIETPSTLSTAGGRI
ncbi:hypothetical protein [Methylobacterium radiotolerans]|uniref:hypothetical protein n=1 Tax=Methylobacterium radiotolerans TaxID=31998 RepID=UPI0038D0140A